MVKWSLQTEVVTPDVTPPTIIGWTPPPGTTDFFAGSDLVATFDEDIMAGSGFILLNNLSAGITALIDVTDSSQVSITGTVPTITPSDVLTGGADYAIQIQNGAIENLSGIAFPGITDDTTWNFSVLLDTTMTANSTWVGGTWSNGQPVPGLNAIIDAGVTGTVAVDNNLPGASPNEWSGTLTLEAASRLNVNAGTNDAPGTYNLLTSATMITMTDAIIGYAWKTNTLDANFVLNGAGGEITAAGMNTTGWNQRQDFNGVISGAGSLTFVGPNHAGFYLNSTNTFSGGLILNALNRYGMQLAAAGAAGTGDVAVNPAGDGSSAVIRLGADDVFATTATLTLNGLGWNNSSGGFGPFAGPYNNSTIRIDMQTFNATVSELYIDDVQQEAGPYTGTDGDWITGTGTLTVLNGPASDYNTWSSTYPGADLSDPAADYDGDEVSNDDERLFGLDPTDPASLNPFPVPLNAGAFSFTRRDDALTGKFSRIETSTDLVIWTEDTGAVLTPGAPDGMNVELVDVQLSDSLLSAPKLFVRVVQDDGILYSETFEDDDGGFTPTEDWQWGTPDSNNGIDLVLDSSNSTNCWGTILTGGVTSGGITPGANSILRSPDIDLTGVSGAQLQVAAAVDAVGGDTIDAPLSESPCLPFTHHRRPPPGGRHFVVRRTFRPQINFAGSTAGTGLLL